MFSRLFCAKDEKTAQTSVTIVAIVMAVVGACIGFLAEYSATLPMLGDGAKIIEVGKVVLPHFLMPILCLCLLSVVLSSADTTLLSSSIIFTRLISGDEIDDRKEIFRTRMVIVIDGLIALLIALQFTNIIGMLLEEYDIKSAKDIEDALKDLLGGTIQEMLESEMDEHLGYQEYERSDNPDYRNKEDTWKLRRN